MLSVIHALVDLGMIFVDDIAYVRDRVRFSCPSCPMVRSVVLMLNGLIEVKNLQLKLTE